MCVKLSRQLRLDLFVYIGLTGPDDFSPFGHRHDTEIGQNGGDLVTGVK